jgi:hypothetical protein
MPVLNPDHLLEQADRLIALPRGGAPRQADLRRAISSAYYGIFHAVLADAADQFAGRTQRRSPLYELVYRSVDHRSLKQLCEDIRKPNVPAKYSKYAPTGGFGPDLIAVATAIVDLQEKRHSAEYDPLFRVGTSDAALAVQTGRHALAHLRGAPRPRKRAFLSLLVFAPR